jgi:hypothetical protein
VQRLTPVAVALMGAMSGAIAVGVLLASGCSSSRKGPSGNISSDASTPQPIDSGTGEGDGATAPDAPSGSADAAQTDDATTEGALTDDASPEAGLGDRASSDDGGDGASDDGTSPDGTSTDCHADIESGSCSATCADAGVTCAVEYTPYSCELAQFADASATVACGQTATVGMACCGECGCVAVEVYYDGTQCWDGVPDCPAGALRGAWFNPHTP